MTRGADRTVGMSDGRTIDVQRPVFASDPALMSGVSNGKPDIGTCPGSTGESHLSADRCHMGTESGPALTVNKRPGGVGRGLRISLSLLGAPPGSRTT